jgi:hypothetical protein
MRGDDRPGKYLSIDIYDDTHLRICETLPLTEKRPHDIGLWGQAYTYSALEKKS